MSSEVAAPVFSADGWTISESRFESFNNRKYEGLFCQGSGQLHLRASLEEHLSSAPQNYEYMRMPANVTAEKFRAVKAKWGTYVPGIYGKHPHLNSQLINLPSFIGLTPLVGGERLDMELSEVSDYSRSLNLKNGVLARSLRWKPKHLDSSLNVRFERFVSAHRPRLCVQRVAIVASAPLEITVESTLDADVRTNGFDHFKSVKFIESSPQIVRCEVMTDNDDQVLTESHLSTGNWSTERQPRSSISRATYSLKAGEEIVIEKRSIVTTSRDIKVPGAESHPSSVAHLSFDELLQEHSEVWSSRWENSDIEISGDVRSQVAVRAAQYHLMRAAAHNDERVSIDAKGYAGEGYFGRFFWDSEIYLVPYFLYTDPAMGKTLTSYRVRTLPGAQNNARTQGYPGARYAWEADASGNECCALWQYRDHEIHITADVVYALAHVARVFGEGNVAGENEIKVLDETTRYWLGRVDYDPISGKPQLAGVMGPDEYQPLGVNNSYTNRMVKFALECTLELGPKSSLSEAERNLAAALVKSLPLPKRASDGLFLQSEDFEKLSYPRFDELWKDRSRPYAAQVPQEVIYRSRNLKQADVLMMMYLFPHEFSLAEIVQAFDFYEPFTTHDSSLSCAIHSIMAQKMNRTEAAWNYWERGAHIDLDFSHDGPAEGIHIAAAAGNWLVVMQGFLGFKTRLESEVLDLTPQLPKQWNDIKARMRWDDTPVSIEASHKTCRVKNRGNRAITVRVWGKESSIAAGAVADWTRD